MKKFFNRVRETMSTLICGRKFRSLQGTIYQINEGMGQEKATQLWERLKQAIAENIRVVKPFLPFVDEPVSVTDEFYPQCMDKNYRERIEQVRAARIAVCVETEMAGTVLFLRRNGKLFSALPCEHGGNHYHLTCSLSDTESETECYWYRICDVFAGFRRLLKEGGAKKEDAARRLKKALRALDATQSRA
ncbi:MAG: hypothetical protein WC817_00130 [Patescibacteria group bacterium]|jgi:hypothetical protein